MGDVVARLGDVVAQGGMWWLSGGCGGSVGDMVVQMVKVAQLVKATGGYQT
jgi:hypothetical protein